MAHAGDLEPDQKTFTGGPLPIDMLSSSEASKLEDFEKKRKLKNRDLIQNPYINSKLLNFAKSQPGGKVLFFAS